MNQTPKATQSPPRCAPYAPDHWSVDINNLLECIGTPVCVADVNGTIRFATSAFAAMFGYPAQELSGRGLGVLSARPPQASMELIARIVTHLRGASTWDGELWDQEKNGASSPTLARVVMTSLGDEPCLMVVPRTCQRSDGPTHDTPSAAALAAFTHEINQPLAAINNYACGALLRIQAGAAPAEVAEVIQKITAQALRAGDIIHRLQAALSTSAARRS